MAEPATTARADDAKICNVETTREATIDALYRLEKEDGKAPQPKDGCPFGKRDSDADGIYDDHDSCFDQAEDTDPMRRILHRVQKLALSPEDTRTLLIGLLKEG